MGTMDPPKDKSSDDGEKGTSNQSTTSTTTTTTTTTTESSSMAITGVSVTNAASITTGLQQHPPPSPLSGCYLLIVLPEPHTAQHKELILNRLAKGFLSWDKDNCHVDLEKELQALVAQSPEGEEARNGERLIQYATENLVTEILIHPQTNTLLQCMRNLLASFTKHRHIIHAGYTFQENGSWILQDGTFSLADFLDAFSEHDVQRVLRAYENTVTVDINCAGISEWNTSRLAKEPCTRPCRVRLNPDDVLTSGVPAITNFINYIEQYLVAQTLDELMQPSDVVGNIRFSHPTLYVFPGGQGDASLFGINGFNMLVDGGFSRKSCFWDFTRHLDRLDAVLFTRLNNSNVGGMASVLRKKKDMQVYPQIGHFFCNLVERKHSNSPDGDKDVDPLILSLTDLGQEMVVNLKSINLRPHPCYRDNEPINLYHKVGHGTLDMYVLSPSKDSREVREFLSKWSSADWKLFSGSHKKDTNNMVFPIQNMVSICALLVWQPANPEDTITRILFPGSTPQHKIFEGIDRLRHLEFMKYPTCSAKTLSPTASLIALKDKSSKLKMSQDKEPAKRPIDVKKSARDETDTIKSTTKTTHPLIQPPAKTKKTSALENKKLADDAKTGTDYPKTIIEIKDAKKETKEVVKKELKKEISKDKEQSDIKKIDISKKTDGDKTGLVVSEPKQKIDKKKKDTKDTKFSASRAKKADAKADVEVKKHKTPPLKKIGDGIKSQMIQKPSLPPPSKPITKPSLPPAKSAKDANNRKVLEQKNKEKMTQKPKAAAPPPPADKKPIVRRKPISSPSKARLQGSPIKSIKSTPTSSIKSDKEDSAIRKIKAEKETADSSTVSTPSAIEIDSTKFVDKCLTEKSEDMSLDSIESKVLADLKEERQVVEEIEAVLQKAERIDDARKVQLEEQEDEAVDKKDEDMTEDDVTAEIDEIPRKSTSRKPSQELTEEDEYLIIEKEEPYTEDSVHSGEAEHKNFLDTVQSEKAYKSPTKEKEKDQLLDVAKEEEEGEEDEVEEDEEEEEEEEFEEEREELEEVEEEEEEEETEDHVEKEVAVEKGIIEEHEKADVPEKKIDDAAADEADDKDKDKDAKELPISDYKEQLVEEMKEIITSATEIVQKAEDKDDSGKKDSEELTKEGLSLSPEKLDSSEKKTDTDIKPEIDHEQVREKLEESQERISTVESGATTTAPTLPEDERISVEGIKQAPVEPVKPVAEEVKKIDKPVIEPKVMTLAAAELAEVKPTTKPFIVRQTMLPRDIVKTPDEVADLPVHEEVDPNLYKVDGFEKDKEEKAQEVKEPLTAVKEQKGVLGFFGKVADKFEKGIDKLTRKSRRDSEKDIDEKSSKSASPKSKSGSPKESMEQVGFDVKEKAEIEAEMKKAKEDVEKPVKEEVKAVEIKNAVAEKDAKPAEKPEIDEEDVGEVEALLEEASKKFKTVKDSLRDSLESLEDQMVEEEMKKAEAKGDDEIKEKLIEVVEKLEEIKPQIDDEPIDKEPGKVKFIIRKDEEGEEDGEDEVEEDLDFTEVTKNVMEAVKDVGEVLAGTAGIKIDEKPKDVIEIVKKVAEVLKEDDFLSPQLLLEQKLDEKSDETGVKDRKKSIAEALTERKESIAEAAASRKESIAETVADRKESIVETVADRKESISAAADDEKESIAEVIADRKESIVDAILDRKESIANAVIERKASIAEAVADRKESIADIVTDRKESVAEAVADRKESIADIVADRKESIVGAVAERKESIIDAVTDRKESIADIVADRKESIVEAVAERKESVAEAVADRKASIVDAVAERKESIIDAVTDRKESITDIIADRKESIVEAVAERKESVAEAVADRKASIVDAVAERKESIIDAVTDRKESIANIIADRKESIVEAVAERKESVAEAVADRRESIVEAVVDRKESIADIISDRKESIIEAVADRKESIADSVASRKTSIAESIADLKESIAEPVADRKESIAEPAADRKESIAESVADRKESIAESVADRKKSIAEPVAERKQSIVESVADRKESIAEPVAERKESIVESVADRKDSIAESVADRKESIAESVVDRKESIAESVVDRKELIAESMIDHEESPTEARDDRKKSIADSIAGMGLDRKVSIPTEMAGMKPSVTPEKSPEEKVSVTEKIIDHAEPSAELISKEKEEVEKERKASVAEAILADRKQSVSESVPSRKESLAEPVLDQKEAIEIAAEKLEAVPKPAETAVERKDSVLPADAALAIGESEIADRKNSIADSSPDYIEPSVDKPTAGAAVSPAEQDKQLIAEKPESPEVSERKPSMIQESPEKEAISAAERKDSIKIEDKKSPVAKPESPVTAAEVVDKKESPIKAAVPEKTEVTEKPEIAEKALVTEAAFVKETIEREPKSPIKDAAADIVDAKAICAELLKDDLSPLARRKRSLGDAEPDDGKEDVLKAGVEEVCTKIDIHADYEKEKFAKIEAEIVTSEIAFEHKMAPAIAEVVNLTPDSVPPSPKFPVDIPQDEDETVSKESKSKIKVAVPEIIEDIVNKDVNIYKIIEEIILSKKIKITVEILEFIAIIKRIPKREVVQIIDQIIVDKKLVPKDVVEDDVDLSEIIFNKDDEEAIEDQEEDLEQAEDEEDDDIQRQNANDFINDNYITKNIKITMPIIQELAAKKGLPVRMIIEIIEEIIIIRKVPRSAVLDISEEAMNKAIQEEQQEEIDEAQEADSEIDDKLMLQIENHLVNDAILKGRKITQKIVDEIMVTYKIPRRIIIEIIEEITVKRKLKRSEIVDIPEDVWESYKLEDDEVDEDEAEEADEIDDKVKLKIEDQIMNDVVSKGKKINQQFIEEIIVVQKIPRRVIIEIIEEIIVRRKLKRSEIVDIPEAVWETYKLEDDEVAEDEQEEADKIDDEVKLKIGDQIMADVISKGKKINQKTIEETIILYKIHRRVIIKIIEEIIVKNKLQRDSVVDIPKDVWSSYQSEIDDEVAEEGGEEQEEHVDEAGEDKIIEGFISVPSKDSLAKMQEEEQDKDLSKGEGDDFEAVEQEYKLPSKDEEDDKRSHVEEATEDDMHDVIEADEKMIDDSKEKAKISPTKPCEPLKAEKDDVSTVKRMVVTATSEDGGEETEICPTGSITFGKQSPTKQISAITDEGKDVGTEKPTSPVDKVDVKADGGSKSPSIVSISPEEKELSDDEKSKSPDAASVKEQVSKGLTKEAEDVSLESGKKDVDESKTSPSAVSPTRKDSFVDKIDGKQAPQDSLEMEKDEKIGKTSPIPSPTSATRKESTAIEQDTEHESIKSSTSPVPSPVAVSPVAARKDSLISGEAEGTQVTEISETTTASSESTIVPDSKESIVEEKEKDSTLPSRKESLVLDVQDKAESVKSATSPAPPLPSRRDSLVVEKDEKPESVKSATSPVPSSPSRKESLVAEKDEKAESVKSATSPAPSSPSRKESLAIERDEKAESVKSATSPTPSSPDRKESLIVEKDEKAESVKSATSPVPSSPSRKESLVAEKDEKAESIKSATSPVPLSPSRKESLITEKDEKAGSVKSATSPVPSSPSRKESLVTEKDEKAESVKSATSPVPTSPSKMEILVAEKEDKAESIKSATSPAPSSPSRKESSVGEKDEKAESIKSATSPAPSSPSRKESLIVDKEEKAESVKSAASPVPPSPSRKESLIAEKEDKAESVKSATSPAPTSPSKTESLAVGKEDEVESIKSATSPAPSSPERKESLIVDTEEKAESVKSATSPAPASPSRKESLAIEKDEKAESVKSATSPAPSSPDRKESLVPEKDDKAESVKSATSPTPSSPSRKESLVAEKDDEAGSIKSSTSPDRKESLIVEKEVKPESVKSATSPVPESPSRKESLAIEKDEKAESVKSTSPSSLSPGDKESLVPEKGEKAESVKSATSPAPSSPSRKESFVPEKEDKTESIKSATSPAPLSPSRIESLIIEKDDKAESIESTTSPAPSSSSRKESLAIEKDEKSESVKSATSPAPSSPDRKESLVPEKDEKAESVKSATSPTPSSPSRKESLAIDKDDKAESVKSATSPALSSPSRKESLVAEKAEKADSVKSSSPTPSSPSQKDEKAESMKSATSPTPLSPSRKESLAIEKDDKADSVKSAASPTPLSPIEKESSVTEKAESLKSATPPASLSPERKESLIVDKAEEVESVKSTSPSPLSPSRKESIVADTEEKPASVKSATSPAASSPSRKESLIVDKDAKAESLKSTSPSPSSPSRKESFVPEKDDKAESIKSTTSPAPSSPSRKESLIIEKDDKAESIKSTTSPAPSSPDRKESLIPPKDDKAESVKSATSPAPSSPDRKESLIPAKDDKAESVKSATSPAPSSPDRKESLIPAKDDKAESVKSATSPAPSSPSRKESLIIEKDDKAESIKSTTSPAPLSPSRKESLVPEKEDKAESIKSTTSPAPSSPDRKESLIPEKEDKAESVKSATSPAPSSPSRKESLVVDQKVDDQSKMTLTISESSSQPAVKTPSPKDTSAAEKLEEKQEIKSGDKKTASPTPKDDLVAEIGELAKSKSPSPVASPSTQQKVSEDELIITKLTSAPDSKPAETSSTTQQKEETIDAPSSRKESLASTTSKIEDRKDSWAKSPDTSKDVMKSTESIMGSKKSSFDEDEDLMPIKEIPSKDRSRSHSLYDTGEKTPLPRSRSASVYEEKEPVALSKEEQLDIQEHLKKYEDKDDAEFEVTLPKRTDIERYILSQYITRNKSITNDVLEEIVALYDVPNHVVFEIIEEICKKKNIKMEHVFVEETTKAASSASYEQMTDHPILANLSFVKRLELEDHITEHYIKPKQKISSKTIHEMAASKDVPITVIYAIIEFLISDRKLSKASLIDETDDGDGAKSGREEAKEKNESHPELDEQVMVSEKKRMEVESYVVEKYLTKNLVISNHAIEEIMKGTSVPRYILLEIIEEIIKRMKISRESVYDDIILSEIEYKERTLAHASGKSTPEGRSSGYSTPDVRHYDDKHESQFHKAFIGGITEIRTTHITTLSGKSTPDVGTRVDTPDSIPESTSGIKTTSIVEKSEPIIIKRTTIVRKEPEHSPGSLSSEMPESVSKQTIVREVSPEHETVSKQTIVREVSPEYETVIKKTIVKREIIEEDDDDDLKKMSKEQLGDKKDSVSMEKVPTQKEHLEHLMGATSSSSGRSTPADKRDRSEGRSSTATPEGFRSEEVIKTTITTTRTMSDDGDIITTTKEVTETTNERGETVVLAKKVDVKVAERSAAMTESMLELAKSSESLRTHGPSDEERLDPEDEGVEFSAEDMSSSFYGQLPSVPPTRSDLPTASATGFTEDFTFKKSSKQYSDMGDYDVDQVLKDYGDDKKDHGDDDDDDDARSEVGSTASSKDPLKGWGTPLKLPPPERPEKFNLRSGPLIHTVDISPDSLDFDIIHDWGEPMRLPSPAPVMDESNKALPSTPKKEAKQPKKNISESVKNRKRSDSPGKNDRKNLKESKKKIQPVYVDLTYVPHHGNSYYASLEFFKRVRARYYVFSGTEPSREVYDALLNAKKTWENKNLEVTMIPTYDTDTLGYWVADNEEALAVNHIDLSPSASRCTINLQDHETSCSAYRLEF